MKTTSLILGPLNGYEFQLRKSRKDLPESPLWPPESTQAARDLEEEVAKLRQTELYPGQANEMPLGRLGDSGAKGSWPWEYCIILWDLGWVER